MSELLGRLKSYFVLDEVPFGNGLFLLLFVELMLILEAVVCEVDHQLLFILDILFSIILDCEPEVARIEESKGRRTVIEEIAADIKLFFIKE